MNPYDELKKLAINLADTANCLADTADGLGRLAVELRVEDNDKVETNNDKNDDCHCPLEELHKLNYCKACATCPNDNCEYAYDAGPDDEEDWEEEDDENDDNSLDEDEEDYDSSDDDEDDGEPVEDFKLKGYDYNHHLNAHKEVICALMETIEKIMKRLGRAKSVAKNHALMDAIERDIQASTAKINEITNSL